MATHTNTYKSQAAREAAASGFGGPSYWAYLDRHALELHERYTAWGDAERAEHVLTQSLSEALEGNNAL